MTCRLIGITKPVIPEVETSSQLLAFCARVSSTANQLNHETGGKLLQSLVKREEWSPYEMVSATMEIETTRDIARQILRHRSFSFQEFSQRYAEVPDKLTLREFRVKHPTDRQKSISIDDSNEWDGPTAQSYWDAAQKEIWEHAYEIYNSYIRQGMAKEVARAVLPEGLTPSRLYMSGTLRSWIHYIRLRSSEATQKEHREIALACREALLKELPELSDVI